MTPAVQRFKIGSRFGQLVLLEYVDPDGEYDKGMVRVKCDCGRRLTVESRRLNGRRERHAKLTDCGGHDAPRGWRVRVGGYRRKPGSMQGLSRPGIMAGGHPSDPEWPVAYVVVAGGRRTEHDGFEEAAAEFRLRSGRKAA